MKKSHPSQDLETWRVTDPSILGSGFAACRRALSGSRSRVPGFLYQDPFIY